MRTSIWNATLDDFRGELATTAPAPAGVSLAAVSAACALRLVVKTLAIAARHKDKPADLAQMQKLIDEATSLSAELAAAADRDASAFDAYLAAVRLPRATDDEVALRIGAIRAALRATIEVPMEAARSAANGIRLCERSVGQLHAFVLADLGAASALLAGAVSAILISVDYNLTQLPAEDALFVATKAERDSIQSDVEERAERIRDRVSGRIR